MSFTLFGSSLITASENGCVKLWKFKKSEQVEINALNGGENLCRMKVSPYQSNRIATGGKKNDLQIWDLEKPVEPVFKAKNVRILHTNKNVYVHFESFICVGEK